MENRSLLQSFAMDKEGRIRSIEEVARGLGCKCVCPCCGEAVVARQGDIREWHFAHAADSDCEGGLETALHLAAKQLLLEHRGITVPETRIQKEIRLPDGRGGKGSAYLPERWVDFSEVEAEKSIGEIRPDIVAMVGNTMLFVEIAVTHFVEAEKQVVLERLAVPTVEIDLDGFKGERWTWELLTEHVIEHALSKRWVYALDEKALSDEAHEAAVQAALAMPPPIAEVHTKPGRTRFWIMDRMVDAIERPFGIAIWSPYDPDLNAFIKTIMRFLGGRWQPRFKNWLVPLEAKDWLFKELGKHSVRPPKYLP